MYFDEIDIFSMNSIYWLDVIDGNNAKIHGVRYSVIVIDRGYS